MIVLKWMGIVLLALILVFMAVTAYGRWHWAERTRQLIDRLNASADDVAPAAEDTRTHADLPTPVQRYISLALNGRANPILAVSMTHSGTFNVGEREDRWRSFVSTQRVVTRPPGFVWDGKVNLLPGVDVHVHDAYLAREGFLLPAVAGLIPLVHLHGGGDIARGELLRFLAESPWYPTVLLPGSGVVWQAVSDRQARAELTDGTTRVSMVFTFGTDGLIESVRAEARGRSVGGQMIPTPWEGRWTDYRWQDGVRVPFSGEVAWLLPEGRKPYWRGMLTSIQFE